MKLYIFGEEVIFTKTPTSLPYKAWTVTSNEIIVRILKFSTMHELSAYHIKERYSPKDNYIFIKSSKLMVKI